MASCWTWIAAWSPVNWHINSFALYSGLSHSLHRVYLDTQLLVDRKNPLEGRGRSVYTKSLRLMSLRSYSNFHKYPPGSTCIKPCSPIFHYEFVFVVLWAHQFFKAVIYTSILIRFFSRSSSSSFGIIIAYSTLELKIFWSWTLCLWIFLPLMKRLIFCIPISQSEAMLWQKRWLVRS